MNIMMMNDTYIHIIRALSSPHPSECVISTIKISLIILINIEYYPYPYPQYADVWLGYCAT